MKSRGRRTQDRAMQRRADNIIKASAEKARRAEKEHEQRER